MEFEVAENDDMEFDSANDDQNIDSEDDSKTGKEKRYQARRKIEDWVEYRKMRDELGWMDDFTTEFGEVY